MSQQKKRPRKRKKVAVVLGAFIFLYSFGLYQGYWQGWKNAEKEYTSEPEPTASPTPAPTLVPESKNGPEFGRIYSGIYKEQRFLFLKPSGEPLDIAGTKFLDRQQSNLGYLWYANSTQPELFNFAVFEYGGMRKLADVRDLHNPQVLSWIQDESTNDFYVAIRYQIKTQPEPVDVIYRLSIGSQLKHEVWRRDLADEMYGVDFQGGPRLIAANQDFLTFELHQCLDCELTSDETLTIVLNSQTNNQKQLENIQLTELNPNSSEFSYQLKIPQLISCDDEMNKHIPCKDENPKPVTLYVAEGKDLVGELP